MALLKTTVKLIIREHALYNFSGPLLALGVPEIYATYPELTNWFPSLAGRRCPLDPAAVKLTEHPNGPLLGWVSADTFFHAFNISDIVTIDIPGCEHSPDIIHDLNAPFPGDLLDRFGLIIDPGTIEHVFDVRTCLTNVVRALRVGGVVVHQVPIYSYNGGYYSINPNVLHDFYTSNGFHEMKSYIIMWDRYWPYTGMNRVYQYSDAAFSARHALADKDQCRYSPMLLFFARKKEAYSEIAIPIQFSGHYRQAMHSGYPDVPISPTFAQKIADRLFEFSRHTIARLLFTHCPYHIALYFSQKLERKNYEYGTRRYSFWM